eukprot:jgi/Astpho2/4137/fgenesh1_pm.00063_%23_46_t
MQVLGTGSFGRVTLAKHRESETVCAVKALSKAHMLKNQQIAHLRAERDVLRMMDFPFIVRMCGCFQDEHCVYFVMEFVAGGEFFRHLKSRGRLTEDAARFYAAEVLLALEYLHKQSIIYRDLKPENILLDKFGHLRMTDFGFAKVIGSKRTYTLCGTPDYLAPEIILNKGHGKPVDCWAFGVLLYEMVAGYPPFFDEEVTQTYKKILNGKVPFPQHMSTTCRNLITSLLQTDLSKRLGCLAEGIDGIKKHPWFRTIDWVAVLHKRLEPPLKPVVATADDANNFDDYSALGAMHHDTLLSRAEQQQFTGF